VRFRDRVVGPILQLKNELFQTFRQRRSIVSVQEYETDKASLERMLADFESDFAKSTKVLSGTSYSPGLLLCLQIDQPSRVHRMTGLCPGWGDMTLI
jgi:hypothetical protein